MAIHNNRSSPRRIAPFAVALTWCCCLLVITSLPSAAARASSSAFSPRSSGRFVTAASASIPVIGGGGNSSSNRRRRAARAYDKLIDDRSPFQWRLQQQRRSSAVPASSTAAASLYRRSRYPAGNNNNIRRQQQQQREVILASSTTRAAAAPKKKANNNGKGGARSSSIVPIDEQDQADKKKQLLFADLTPLGRLVAGTVEVGVVTAFEYLSGLFGGYVLGSVTGLPGLLFRPLIDPATMQQPPAFWTEAAGRFGRMHQKSASWGKNWAGISATLGGMRVAIRVIRGGVEDEWNTVFSSMAAGAFFKRAEGPQAMVQGALVYGGLVYVLYGGFGKKKQPFEYQEAPVEF